VKRCLALALLVGVTALASGEEKPNPSALTPKEIADGWILLFDGKTTFGWQIDGEAKVEDGALVLGGTKATTARPTSSFGEGDLKIVGISGGTLTMGAGSVLLHKSSDDSSPLSKVTAADIKTDKGSTIEKVFPLAVKAGEVVRISSIRFKPTGMQALFNGKDLSGWKKFEANPASAKSEFTVADGTIHLKNGKGDLQSEGQYADFVLQVECKTNGPHLNSGVFFRCIPGLYQQGYEAQIHNHFTAEPKREYVIEDYDPKTNELKNKTKVKATAVDFGTGAIYRRVPARGPAAEDGQWFTMTIVANGRHLATWVNGIQQTDWTDNRPVNENARNGCRLEKGAISLQGHDKTTDLNFRNIRIEELPAGK
jgi:hypothetical protein